MKKKTARRFVRRRLWKYCREVIIGEAKNSFSKRFERCAKIVSDAEKRDVKAAGA